MLLCQVLQYLQRAANMAIARTKASIHQLGTAPLHFSIIHLPHLSPMLIVVIDRQVRPPALVAKGDDASGILRQHVVDIHSNAQAAH